VTLDLHPPLPHLVYLPVVAFNRSPSLSLTKSADSVAYAGERLKYSLRIDNSGGLARNLVVSDVLPARTIFSDCDCQAEADACDVSFACGLDGDRVVWSVDELAANSALEMILWVTVDADLSDGESIVNELYAAVADGVRLPSGPPVTTPVRWFHVSVSKTAWPNPVMVGQELTFTIQVTKSGSLLENVRVTDLLPSGVSYVDGNCEGGLYCKFVPDNDKVTVVWWLDQLRTYSENVLTVRVTVTHASSGRLVNELYGVKARAEVGSEHVWYIMGEPLVVSVLDPAHYVYWPFVLPGSSPWPWSGRSPDYWLNKAFARTKPGG